MKPEEFKVGMKVGYWENWTYGSYNEYRVTYNDGNIITLRSTDSSRQERRFKYSDPALKEFRSAKEK